MCPSLARIDELQTSTAGRLGSGTRFSVGRMGRAPVHIVAATDSLAVPGGSETYLLAVAEQLVRFGHRVTIHAQTIGPISEAAQQLGAAVVGEGELPGS